MSTSNRIAGPLLASIFIGGGYDAFRNPESKVKAAEAVTGPLSARFDALPDDTAMLVKMNGAVQVAAGALLAAGKFRRLAALTLIGSIIPTTYAGHRFWEELDDEKRAQQQTHFLKNLGVLGGLILAATERSKPKSDRHQVKSKPNEKAMHRVQKDSSKVTDKAGRLKGALLTKVGALLPTSS